MIWRLWTSFMLLAVVGGAAIVSATPAGAHGDPEFSGDVGPFAVQTFDEQISDTSLLYTVVVKDTATGLPISGATIDVTATSADRRAGPLVGNELGGAYQVLLPDVGDGDWQIEVRISVAGETVAFSHALTPRSGQAKLSWRTALFVAVSLAGLAIAVVFLASGRRSVSLEL